MNIKFKSEQADICNVPVTKTKPQTCIYMVDQLRKYTISPTEGKKLHPRRQPVMLKAILFHTCKIMMLFSLALIVTGVLATQIPAAMVGTGWSHLCLCLRVKTSSEYFSPVFTR